MSEDLERVEAALLSCAEHVGDITPPVYEAFFNRSKAGRALMGHSDEYMRGRMMEQVIELLLSDEHLGPDGYLEWELSNHIDAYGVPASTYAEFFGALTEVVSEGAGAAWDAQTAQAFANRIQCVLSKVAEH